MWWEDAVVFDFLQRADSAFQAIIVCKVDTACATLSDPFPDQIAVAQDLPVPQRLGQDFSFSSMDCVLYLDQASNFGV
jgi:hypothetical protein